MAFGLTERAGPPLAIAICAKDAYTYDVLDARGDFVANFVSREGE